MYLRRSHFTEPLRLSVNVERVVPESLVVISFSPRINAVRSNLQDSRSGSSREPSQAVGKERIHPNGPLCFHRIVVVDIRLDDTDGVDDPRRTVQGGQPFLIRA